MKSLLIISILLLIDQVYAADLLQWYEEDQSVREHYLSLEYSKKLKYLREVIAPGDQKRLQQVEDLLSSSDQSKWSAEEFFAAAMILQHGQEARHYKLAMKMAKKAVSLDSNNKNAAWLLCAAEDRYLRKIGEPQIWGTQLRQKMNVSNTYEIYYLDNLDKKAVSDKQRKKCGLPSLSEMEDRLNKMKDIESLSEQYTIWKEGT